MNPTSAQILSIIILAFFTLTGAAAIVLGILANRKLHPKPKKFQGVDLTEIFGLNNEPEEPKKVGRK